MVDIQTVSVVVASTSVMIAAVYYVFQVRHQRRSRDIDLVMRLYATFSKKEFQQEMQQIMNDCQTETAFAELAKKYGAIAPESSLFFEGLGVLLHRKLIDIGLVDDLFSGMIIRYWEACKPFIEDARKHLNYPQYAEWFEYLYNEMKKRQQRLETGKNA
ncbi:MAG: hypothetical protein QXJ31_02800 [Candidatus Bathyarchaeia archaeon]